MVVIEDEDRRRERLRFDKSTIECLNYGELGHF